MVHVQRAKRSQDAEAPEPAIDVVTGAAGRMSTQVFLAPVMATPGARRVLADLTTRNERPGLLLLMTVAIQLTQLVKWEQGS